MPVAVTALDKTYGESSHRWPRFLPDGQHFLFTTATGCSRTCHSLSLVKSGALESSELVTLFPLDSSVEYASGHLLFVRDGTLMAQPFDPTNRKETGEAFPLAEDVGNEGSRYSSFSVSPTGVLVYSHGAGYTARRLAWTRSFGPDHRASGRAGQLLRHRVFAGRTSCCRVMDEWRSRESGCMDRGPRSRCRCHGSRSTLPRRRVRSGRRTSSRIVFTSLDALRQKPVAGAAGDELLFKRRSLNNARDRFQATGRQTDAMLHSPWSTRCRALLTQISGCCRLPAIGSRSHLCKSLAGTIAPLFHRMDDGLRTLRMDRARRRWSFEHFLEPAVNSRCRKTGATSRYGEVTGKSSSSSLQTAR